jgi:hypothetical protein
MRSVADAAVHCYVAVTSVICKVAAVSVLDSLKHDMDQKNLTCRRKLIPQVCANSTVLDAPLM